MKKVQYIKYNSHYIFGLTIGHLYEVLEESTTYYMLLNDNGIDFYYFEKEYFMSITEIRKLKLLKLNENNK